MKVGFLTESNLINMNVREITVTLVNEESLMLLDTHFVASGDYWHKHTRRLNYNSRGGEYNYDMVTTDIMLHEIKILLDEDNFHAITFK